MARATVALVVYGLAGVGVGLLAGAAYVAVARLLADVLWRRGFVLVPTSRADAGLAEVARRAEAREQRARGCEVGR